MKYFTLPSRPPQRADSPITHNAEHDSRLAPGKVKLGILLWLLGVPLPIVLIIVLVRSCMG